MPRFQDLTRQTFGELKVLRRAPNRGRHTYWECLCLRTKKIGEVESGALKSGHTKTSRGFTPKPMQKFKVVEEYLRQFSWCLNGKGYFEAQSQRIKLMMHKEIWRFYWGDVPEGYEIDHIDLNTLNNNIDNLRLVTHQQNMLNKTKSRVLTSKYKGVSWDKKRKKWCLRIDIKGLSPYVNYYDTEYDAAINYDLYMIYMLPASISMEHDLPGNKPRFVPLLNIKDSSEI